MINYFLSSDVFAEGNSVIVEGSLTFLEEAIATPPVAESKACYMNLLLYFFIYTDTPG